jgi:predicted  nucleic acid-binding Zn-ribbon protein
MKVTGRLVRVYRVDMQIRGLSSRLEAAQRFLDSQSKELTGIESKRAAVQAQLRQVGAAIADHEGETKTLDERVATLREQMNGAQTDREYKAFLSEVKTFESQKSELETEELELMAKSDKLKAQLEEYERLHAERRAMQQVARTDRDKKAEEIRERLDELKAERTTLAPEVPTSVLDLYERQFAIRGDEAMAPVQEEDRKRHEYSCGSCMMNIPIESVSALLSRGDLTQCGSCGAILYLDEELSEQMQAALSKR